jgi:hypothetical protein
MLEVTMLEVNLVTRELQAVLPYRLATANH